MAFKFNNHLLRKRASPEIARFNGMKIMLFYNDHEPAHIHVEKNGKDFRLDIANLVPLKGEVAPPGVLKDLVAWLKTKIPLQETTEEGVYASTTVGDLVWEQWWKVRNQVPPDKVPTPDQIRAMKKPSGKISSYNTRSMIENVRVRAMNPGILWVWFADGSLREVDVKEMRKECPPFDRIFSDFDVFKKFRFNTNAVMWGRGLSQLEIESRDLYAVGLKRQ